MQGTINYRPRNKRPRSIRTLLAWLVLACLLPGMIGATLLFVHEYRTGRAQLEQDTIATARALAQTVDSQLHKAKSTAEALASVDTLQKRDLAAFHRYAREVLVRTGSANIIVISDASGQQLLNTLRDYGVPLPRHGNMNVVQRVFKTGQPVISNIYQGGVLKKPVMSIDVPVIRNGKVIYDLSIGLVPAYFNRILEAQGIPPGWVAGIFDSTGTLAGRVPSPEQFVGQKGSAEFIQRISEAPEGTMEAVTRENIRTLSGWSRSNDTGWSVGIGIPLAELEGNLKNTLYQLAAGMAVLLVLGLLLAWIFGRRITRSLHSLTLSADALGAGKSIPELRLDIREAVDVEDAIVAAADMLAARTIELEETNKALLVRDADLKVAHHLARFGDWRWNVKTGEVFVSDSVREVYGREVPSFPEQRGTLLPVESWEKVEAAMQKVVQTGVGYDLELQVNHGSGTTIWVNAKCDVVRNAGGEVEALVGTIIDITERKHAELLLEATQKAYEQELEQQVAERTSELTAANEELERLTRKDALTGLQNRISAHERLRLEFIRLKRTGSVYSVLFMDIDHFKNINDTYGHETGDQILRQVGRKLQHSIRESDLVARFGGEEFLAILSDTDKDGAMAMAGKVGHAIEEDVFPIIERLTISIGVAQARAEDENEDAVVRRADLALYQAKKSGRNAVRFGE